MSKGKDLNYWKANAEEDYKQVPISVLRYITELETAVKNCSIPDVSNRITDDEIKHYRKEGYLASFTKKESFYKLAAKQFEENYKNKDFNIKYDC